eukprot:scaffold67369_cov49-Phaeocystis_antarctica.AAC.2
MTSSSARGDLRARPRSSGGRTVKAGSPPPRGSSSPATGGPPRRSSSGGGGRRREEAFLLRSAKCMSATRPGCSKPAVLLCSCAVLSTGLETRCSSCVCGRCSSLATSSTHSVERIEAASADFFLRAPPPEGGSSVARACSQKISRKSCSTLGWVRVG